MDVEEDKVVTGSQQPVDEVYPAIIRGEDILIPVKIDISIVGARFVDTFCWNINNRLITCSDFATKICEDKNLPFAFQMKIAMQLAEQIQAYQIIISSLKECFAAKLPAIEKLKKPIYINVGIRLNTLDYADRFIWDPMSDLVSPESFAKITCADLGLPLEMQSAIAHKIREILFRNMISWLEDPAAYTTPDTVDDSNMKPSEVKVSVVSIVQATEMTTNLWKRAKPSSYEELASIPQPMLPANRDTNAGIWKK
jgi:hypothetical protein